MFWPTRCKVICGMSNFNVSDICSILMEHSDAPPGFVRLKLLNYTPGEKMVFFTVDRKSYQWFLPIK